MNSLHAWVLLAIGLAANDEPVTLLKIIGAADAVNHSVLTADEIDSAFRVLTSLGLIAPEGAQVALTPEGEALVEAAVSQADGAGSWMSQLKILSELIAGLPTTPLSKEQESRLPTNAEAHTAIQAYLARAQQTLGVGAYELHSIQMQLAAQATTRLRLSQRVAAAVNRFLHRK